MEIIKNGEGEKKGRTFQVKCSCGCEFKFNEYEAIPVPQYGQHDELTLIRHNIRCPRCNTIVEKITNN